MHDDPVVVGLHPDDSDVVDEGRSQATSAAKLPMAGGSCASDPPSCQQGCVINGGGLWPLFLSKPETLFPNPLAALKVFFVLTRGYVRKPHPFQSAP